jgi:hypothetical protein
MRLTKTLGRILLSLKLSKAPIHHPQWGKWRLMSSKEPAADTSGEVTPEDIKNDGRNPPRFVLHDMSMLVQLKA